MIVEKTIQLDNEDRRAINRTMYILKAINENGLYGLKDLEQIQSGIYYAYGNINFKLVEVAK